MRHAESAVAQLPQMLLLLVQLVGSNERNLALALHILALISSRLATWGFCCLSSRLQENILFLLHPLSIVLFFLNCLFNQNEE